MKLVVDVPHYPPGLAALRKIPGVEIVTLTPPEDEETPRPADLKLVGDAAALFCSYPPTNNAEMKALKWIHVASTGFDQLLPLRLPGRGIRASNARGCFDVPIAEWNVAMMINLARNLRQMIRNQDKGVWDRSAVFQHEIRGQTVGLWGYGGIGRETARLAKHMGLRVHVMARSGVKPRRDVYTLPGTGDPEGVIPDKVFTKGQELEFLTGLDFLILSMPLTSATRGLLGERELQALPRSALLLNPARGPIIQEAALIRALREKWIAGAALDTHYAYPLPPEHPLWHFPNVILTPHISGSSLSPHYAERLWDALVQNVARFVAGQPLLNELTPAELNA